MHRHELVSVQIIPIEQDHPPGTPANAEMIVEADTGPRRGLTLIGGGNAVLEDST